MGKVSVVGQQQNVQAESQSPPALPGLGGAENIEGNGPTGALEGLCKLEDTLFSHYFQYNRTTLNSMMATEQSIQFVPFLCYFYYID